MSKQNRAHETSESVVAGSAGSDSARSPSDNNANNESFSSRIAPEKQTNSVSSCGERATGPRSQAGKHNSSRNAVSHGVFASAVVVPGESSARYFSLVRQIEGDLEPIRGVDKILAERLATILWRQARLLRMEAAEVTRSTELESQTRFEPGTDVLGSSSLAVGKIRARQEDDIRAIEQLQAPGKKKQPLVPTAEFLERLMNYEKHLGREFDRVLGQLERIRRLRGTGS